MKKWEIIADKAIMLLRNNPDGLRYSELLKKIKQALPEQEHNTIQGTIVKLTDLVPNKVFKPSTGLFKLREFGEESAGFEQSRRFETSIKKSSKIKEEDFYQPFAEYIVNELDECTRAIPLGRKIFQDKWGTPDVIGIRELGRGSVIQVPTEIISAEIKTNTLDLIQAFGQANAYKLFSHKSYIVVPNSSSREEIARLDVLSRICGIGLILFDNKSIQEPKFEIKVRAARNEPDMFYIEKYIKLIKEKLFPNK